MKPKLNLDSLIVLDAIARKKSFSAAAHELHRVPSSITYAIQKLEDSLDVSLFDRQGHRANLTPAGEALLKEGRTLLSMANNLERNVQHIAMGWEAELKIAMDDLVPFTKLLDLCEKFYEFSPTTQLRLSTEVLGGTWDALISCRADLVIGLTGEGPPGGGYSTHPMGDIEFVFVVSPDHPLANKKEPLSNTLIQQYRAVVASDSSRQLAPKTVGLLLGQPTLTVSDLENKITAQKQGLGVGSLPRHMISKELKSGALIVKETEDGGSSNHTLNYAWNTCHKGKALAWFKQQLCDDKNKIDWFTESE
ncbi:MAG: LysR family transcriptional regulator [Methylococcales bacterium]